MFRIWLPIWIRFNHNPPELNNFNIVIRTYRAEKRYCHRDVEFSGEIFRLNIALEVGRLSYQILIEFLAVRGSSPSYHPNRDFVEIKPTISSSLKLRAVIYLPACMFFKVPNKSWKTKTLTSFPLDSCCIMADSTNCQILFWFLLLPVFHNKSVD
jgi:hypothetical protein